MRLMLELAVDCVLFGLDDRGLQVLLIQRAIPPFQGLWALPGGFVLDGESIDQAVHRELREETGLRWTWLEQLHTFGDTDRDPRGRVVTVAYVGLVRIREHSPVAASDADKAAWHPIEALPDLAFDHNQILMMALTRIRDRIQTQPLGVHLLPESFTLSQMRELHEQVLGCDLDKRNFQRKIMSSGLLKVSGKQQGVPHRAATLYRIRTAAEGAVEASDEPS
jgi:8-oxo-dGTP diphosphatase